MMVADKFVHTILAHPDADAPRLVCADWLEEQGDPQAELIRLQCELARLDHWEPRRPKLQVREKKLREAHDATWFGPIRNLCLSGVFHRGFMDVHVSGVRTYLNLAERIFSLPWVLHARVTDGAAGLNDLEALVASPYFSRLVGLDLTRCQTGTEGVQVLAKAMQPCRLAYLNLNHNRLTSNAVGVLAESLDLSRLTALLMYGNAIGPAGAGALAACTQLGRLRVLDLSYNRLGTTGADCLSEALSLNQLQTLYVKGNRIGAQGKLALRRRFGRRVHLGSAGSPF